MKLFMLKAKRKLQDTQGINTIEIVLIVIVLVALVVVFRAQIMDLFNSIFTQLNKSVKGLY